jgi:hypothetical protein
MHFLCYFSDDKTVALVEESDVFLQEYEGLSEHDWKGITAETCVIGKALYEDKHYNIELIQVCQMISIIKADLT